MSKSENQQQLPVLPDEKGHFGIYGGRFVSEVCIKSFLLILHSKKNLMKTWPIM